jgi:precorrin-3B methylase
MPKAAGRTASAVDATYVSDCPVSTRIDMTSALVVGCPTAILSRIGTVRECRRQVNP